MLFGYAVIRENGIGRVTVETTSLIMKGLPKKGSPSGMFDK